MTAEPPSEEPVRVHVFLTGRVQGVGMRMTVRRCAEDAHVIGWVRNLTDGRVEFVAEGPKRALNSMLLALSDARPGLIREMTKSWQKAFYEGATFEILP